MSAGIAPPPTQPSKDKLYSEWLDGRMNGVMDGWMDGYFIGEFALLV